MSSRSTTMAPGGAAIWTAAFREAVWLAVAAILITALVWSVRPDGLPLSASADVYELELPAPLLAVDQGLVLYEEGDHLFIDTRDDTDRRQAIPGSFRIRADRLDEDLRELRDDLFPEDPVILYGDGDLVIVANVAQRLLDRGFTDVQILGVGLQGWQTGGGELSPVATVTETDQGGAP